jgi:L-malate glycosyltransferase
MSESAIKRVHEKFAIEVVAAQYVQLLKKLAGVNTDDNSGVKGE